MYRAAGFETTPNATHPWRLQFVRDIGKLGSIVHVDPAWIVDSVLHDNLCLFTNDDLGYRSCSCRSNVEPGDWRRQVPNNS